MEVISCVLEGKDKIVSDGRRYIWHSLPTGLTPRQTSRYPKMFIHNFTKDVSIWLDGNVELTVPPEQCVRDFLIDDFDIAVFKHMFHNCVYLEGKKLLEGKYDDVNVIIPQLERYKKEGMPEHFGLAYCGFILRKNNDRVKKFNELWWNEYVKGSQRDQLSFMYCVWKSGIKVNFIEPTIYKHPYIKVNPHLIPTTKDK